MVKFRRVVPEQRVAKIAVSIGWDTAENELLAGDRLISRNTSERDRAADSRSQSLVGATVPRSTPCGQT
jgi:hypothetical protein